MRKKNFMITVFLICVTALSFSGCGNGGEKNPRNTREEGQELFLQMRLPDSLNPLDVTNISVRDAFSLCYEPLFALDESLEPKGVLARTIQLADDAQSAVVMLKDGVLWHDGKKFTSKDVIYTVNLLKENPASEYYKCVKYIESITAINDESLKITLSRPYGQIAYSLTFPIVASHNDNLAENILGTGPYKVKKYSVSSLLELEKFDKYHKGEPLTKKASVSVIRDRETATSAFNTGVINVTTSESFDTENSTVKSKARTTLYPSSTYEFMAFNHKRAPFSSQNVRSAIASAQDRTEIAKICYTGAADAANSPINPAAHSLAENSMLSQYNLANAREMLFFEGYEFDESTQLLKKANGEKLSFTLLVNSDNQSRVKSAELLREQLLEAGIEMNIRAVEFSEYEQTISSGDFDAYLGGTRINNPYDFEFLLSRGGALNNFGYESEYMDLALAALASAVSEDSLADAAENFEEVFSREQPICGIVFLKDMLITGESVMGKLLPTLSYPYANIANWSVKH